MGVVPEVFLWGVFRRRRPQRQTTTDKGKLPFNSHPTSGPPGFSEVIYRNQAQRGRQAVTSTPVIDSRAADVSPAFSGPICPPKRR